MHITLLRAFAKNFGWYEASIYQFCSVLGFEENLGFQLLFFPFPFFWMELPRARLWDGVFKTVKSGIFQKNSRLVRLPTYQADIGTRLVWPHWVLGTSVGSWYQTQAHKARMHILVLCEFFNNFRFLVFLKLWRSKNLSNNIIGFFKFQTWRFLTELVIF